MSQQNVFCTTVILVAESPRRSFQRPAVVASSRVLTGYTCVLITQHTCSSLSIQVGTRSLHLFPGKFLSLTGSFFKTIVVCSRCLSVKTVLQYASNVWAPYLIKHINVLEKVHKHFMKRILSLAIIYPTLIAYSDTRSWSVRITQLYCCTHRQITSMNCRLKVFSPTLLMKIHWADDIWISISRMTLTTWF